jgi:uncharacterized membrane protein
VSSSRRCAHLYALGLFVADLAWRAVSKSAIYLGL